MKKIAVIGAGVAGMAAAKRTRDAGHEVHLYEAASKPGGLVRTFKIADTRLECFYHHIFKTDTHVVDMIKECGLGDQLLWLTSQVGFYTDGKLWDFAGPVDLLKFKPLPFFDRVKFGLQALYFQKKNTWQDLENQTVKEFICKYPGGQQIWDKVWKPLLIRKFGPGYETVTAAWLWGRINPRANSRSDSGGEEKLGYMTGSFQAFLDAFEQRLETIGVTKRYHSKVTKIERDDAGEFTVHAADTADTFDAVIFTGPNDKFLECTEGLGIDDGIQQKLKEVRYQSAMCTVLEMTKPLSHIYWLNISDTDIPFGGIIEQTNFIPKKHYNDHHVAYIFNYVPWEHEYLGMEQKQLLDIFYPALKKMFPHFDEANVVKTYNFVDKYASPAYIGRYSEFIPPHEMNVPGLYLGSMTQIYPEDRNMNNSMGMGYNAADKALAYLNAKG